MPRQKCSEGILPSQSAGETPAGHAAGDGAATMLLPVCRTFRRLVQCVHFLFFANFQQQWRRLRRGAQQFHRFFPIDGALPRPQVRVFVPCRYREHGSSKYAAQDLKSLADRVLHVRVAKIETHADIVEVRALDQFHQLVRRRKFVRNILQQNAHAERLGKRAQMFNGGHGRFELLSR